MLRGLTGLNPGRSEPYVASNNAEEAEKAVMNDAD
jgi:hypothetical protein